MQMCITVPFTNNANADDQSFKMAEEILMGAANARPTTTADGHGLVCSADVPADKTESVRTCVRLANADKVVLVLA